MAVMDLINVSLLVSFIFTSWSPVLGKLLFRPNDVVVGLGETVQLNCSTDDKYSVNWWHVPVGSTTNEDVFISRVVVLPYHPRFKIQRNEVDNSIHDYNLVISSVSREDAGKYTCIDRAGHGEQWDAQLVVLEPGPECQTNIDREGFVGDNDCKKRPEEIRCSCSQQYFGNKPPAMEWTNVAGEVIESQPPVDTSQRNIISSYLAVKPRLAMIGTSIVWRAQLLKHNWTSADIIVKYVTKNATEVNVTRGESIVCSANSSETCTYQWTMQNGTMVSKAANLTIADTGTYFCDATCSLRHGKCVVRSLVVEFKKIHEGNTKKTWNGMAWTAAGVILGICLVSLFVALFVILYYQRAKRRKKKKYLPCERNGEYSAVPMNNSPI